jgi:GNAT superfamily N-acetyltransferase
VWPNYLFDARYNDPEILIDHIKILVNSGNAPSQWFLGPASYTPELVKTMNINGFVYMGSWPGMAVDLDKINTNFSGPNDLRVEEISDKNSLLQFEQVVSTAMFGGGVLGVDLITGLYGDENIHLYLAFLNDKPVATTLLFTSAGIAGLYLISTLPEYRNMGIGKKITLAPLLGAKQLGYKIGGLFATELGEKIYSRLGFKKYCDFDIYYL